VLPDNPPQRPENHVIWMKDGVVIETLGTKKYRHQRMKKRLIIYELTDLDSGMYECAFSLNSTMRGRAELWSKYRINSKII